MFNNPTPIEPHPKARHSASRETSTIRALGESKSVLQRLINFLAPYKATSITSLDGRKYQVLAINQGMGNIVASSSDHSFLVLKQNAGTAETPVWQAKVVADSYLFKSLRPDDDYAITTLDTWFALTTTDRIWLGVVFDSDGDPTSAAIDSIGQSDSFDITQNAWAGANGYCEDDGGDPPVHQTSRKLIAYTTDDGEGNPVLHQVMFHDQVLRDVALDGRAARYPFDHEGGYPL